MQRVVRQLVGADVVPDIVMGPLKDGADLRQAIGGIEIHRLRLGARCRLLMAHAGYPGTSALHGTTEHLDLAHMAAGEPVLHAVVEPVDAVLRHQGFKSHRIRIVDADAPAVAPLQPLDEVDGLLGQPTGVEGEDLDLRHVIPDEVREHDGLGPEAAGVHHLAVVAHGSTEDVEGGVDLGLVRHGGYSGQLTHNMGTSGSNPIERFRYLKGYDPDMTHCRIAAI